MICQKCSNAGRHVVFNTFQYFYCDTCKEEIQLELMPRNEKKRIHLDINGERVNSMEIDLDLLKQFEQLVEKL